MNRLFYFLSNPSSRGQPVRLAYLCWCTYGLEIIQSLIYIRYLMVCFIIFLDELHFVLGSNPGEEENIFSRLLVLLLFILLYVNDFVRRKTGNDPPQKVINSVVGPVLFFGSKYPSLPALILIPAPFYIKYLESIKSMIFFLSFYANSVSGSN